MAADFSEKERSSRTVYAGKLLTVKEDEVVLPSGGSAQREYPRAAAAATGSQPAPHIGAATTRRRQHPLVWRGPGGTAYPIVERAAAL